MDFEIGDRICKVRGINSGKSGTIRSVLPNGTVGVVFDGEKTVRYCDPGNCAKPTMIPTATNSKFKVGQMVKIQGRVTKVYETSSGDACSVRFDGTNNDIPFLEKDVVAANAKFKVGDLVTDSYGMRLFEVTGIEPGGIYNIVDYENGTARYTMQESKMKKASASLVKSYTNSTAKNAKFRKGDFVYLGGVEKMEVMAPTDAHGWTKCKYLEGTRKGMVIDMPTPELKSAKNACAANASVKVRPEIQKEYDAYVKAKEKFDKWWNPNRSFAEGVKAREAKELHEAEKALWTKWRAVFGTPIPSGWAGNPSVLANANVEVDGSKLKFTDKTGKWHGPFKNWDELEREMGKYGISINYETVTNAATDAEFEKIKAMGKTAGDKYFRDNYQSFIDKYGFKDALELGKRISRIKYKPIKKGRYAGKGPDGMTYYVDYTSDRWFAKKYGKDGTNVTEIQIQGPYVKDPDGKERRHILYLYGSGIESIHPANQAVAQLVKQIMRGPDVLKQDAADYAWNEEVKSSNPVVANALKAARNAKSVANFRAGFGWRETKRGEHGKTFKHAGGYFLVDSNGRNMSPNFDSFYKLEAWADREGIIIDDRKKYDF